MLTAIGAAAGGGIIAALVVAGAVLCRGPGDAAGLPQPSRHSRGEFVDARVTDPANPNAPLT